MKKSYLITLILIAALLLAGCSREERSQESVYYDADSPVGLVAQPPEAAEEGGAADDFANSEQEFANPMAPEAQVQERLIIRTGEMEILVEDTEAVLAEIGQVADNLEGWVVSSNVYQYDTSKAGTITLRIPAEAFDTAVARIREMALEVNRLTTSSQDVTEEYVDLGSRLGNLEATAERVRSFLDEADEVEEALAVNQELSRLESEIEVIKGRMQYLSQSAAYSTLTVSLTPDILSEPIQVGGWRPQGVAREAIEDLVEALQALTDFGIRVVLFVLPLLLVVGLPVWLVARVVTRWLRRRRQPAVVAAPAKQ
jgi:hypothetical protein